MADPSLLRRVCLHFRPIAAASGCARAYLSNFHEWRSHYATCATSGNTSDAKAVVKNGKKKGNWFTLPPFSSTIDGSALGKELSGRGKEINGGTATTMTALKWILRCCPQLPRSLVQKLFRLRQVRRESSESDSFFHGEGAEECRLRRVAAKDSMNLGDRIFLPVTVQEMPPEEVECICNEEEVKYLKSLELYKDPAIIVVNKPPGMPVQGGIGIRRSLDELAAMYWRYEYSHRPRLVHRLDRDSSGILVMGRTQLSATVLHSIFREKTFGASEDKDLDSKRKILQKKYLALVIGSPRRQEGLISVPLGKVVVDNGKSERITVLDNVSTTSSQHAITEYRVIGSSCHDYTWLELSPLTGRKHQLRVHCAEVLGTPIVGDYKYGWQAHKNLKHLPCFKQEKNVNEILPKGNIINPFGLDLESGSISDKQPRLHLHCKKMVLPDVSLALQHLQASSDSDLRELKSLKLLAPLPLHMQKSWDILNCKP